MVITTASDPHAIPSLYDPAVLMVWLGSSFPAMLNQSPKVPENLRDAQEIVHVGKSVRVMTVCRSPMTGAWLEIEARDRCFNGGAGGFESQIGELPNVGR